jgi:AcrR family transcriptional regulator
MPARKKRTYSSQARADSAEETRKRILDAARALFGRRGIDRVTIADIGARADVAGSTVYAVFKSKTGIIRALMELALFGDRFRSAQELLAGVTDPVKLVELTPRVARAIYESESLELGLLRNASGFSPELRKVEEEFERIRYDMQERRLRALFEAGKARKGLSLDEARRILWTLTSRELYRKLVDEGGFSPERYELWLSQTLLEALVAPRYR